jgi:phosphoribulokinase
MPANHLGRPIILGIVGDSAAGKTTLTNGVAQILGSERVATICTDDYHACDRKERAENGLSALDPRCNYMDILEQHLKLLRQGQPILKPVYNHEHGTLDRPEYIAPKRYIIVEGLLGYSTRAMRDCYDVKIFLDPDPELRIRWKVKRDTEKRGYTRDEVMAALEKRRFDSPAHIEPQRTFADIVVNFFPPPDQTLESGEHLNVRHILRPTLPHPDLTPILGSSAQSGLHLELSRDTDGKPVDVLEIAGTIAELRAVKVEELLWALMPEASHLRSRLGAFDGPAISHPLALTQLFIAYHMLKAAQGIHAV